MSRPIWPEDEYPNAVQWSLGGAAQAVTGYRSGATKRLALVLGFRSKFPVNQMNGWQDAALHSKVLKRIDQALGAITVE